MKSTSHRKTLALAAAVLIALPGIALAADDLLKGTIVSHQGSTIIVKAGASETEVTLSPSTSIRTIGIGGEDRPSSDLLRGLPVQVKGFRHGNTITAEAVSFKKSDLKVAKQIAAGIADTESRVSANADRIEENALRIDNAGEYDIAGRTNVLFAVGSAVISDKGKADLHAISNHAKSIKGYRVAVVGRADKTGNALANQKLSERRAAAVTDYLYRECGVLPGRVMPPVGTGSLPVAQDPHPPKNAAEARRVTVTIAVSKSARRGA